MTEPASLTSLVRAAERAEERGDFVESRRLHAEAAAMCTADVRRRRAGDLTRIPALIGEVRRYCLGSVLRTLSPSVRVAFVLVDVMGVGPVAAAAMLGATDSALQVRLGRARRSLADYLGPRCAHLGRRNPCTCAGRLGRALDAGLVTLPRRPVAEPPPGPFASPAALYQALPLAVPDLAAIAPDDVERAGPGLLVVAGALPELHRLVAAEFGVVLAGWFDLHRARCNRADHFGFLAERMTRRGRFGWARALYARAAVHEEVLLGLAPPPDLLGVFARSAAACWRKARHVGRLTALVHRLEPLGLPPVLWAEIQAMHSELTRLRRPQRLTHARRRKLHARRRRWAWRNLAWHRFASNMTPNPREQQALAAHRHLHRQLRGARAEGPA